MTQQTKRRISIDLNKPLIAIFAVWAVLSLCSAIRSLKPTVTITVPQTKTTVQVPQQAVLPDPRSFR